jgi:pantetheine-phosphate adenylyltransferase
VRGAIFNVLGPLDSFPVRALDLYAGTGSLGIEALSRGAVWADLVERHPRQCAVLRENVASTGFAEQAGVHCMSATRALGTLEGPYQLVLMDPPYKLTSLDDVVEGLARSTLLESGTRVVVGHSKRLTLQGTYLDLTRTGSYRYGDSAVDFFRERGLRVVTAIYPGSFDPVTEGHVDIATRAAAIFNRVVVAVYDTPSKKLLFDTDERVDLFERSVEGMSNVEVSRFSGLAVQAARRVGAGVIVRGLRSGSDFEYEFEMAYMNKKLAPDVEMVCMMASLPYQYVSSSLVKEVIGLGGDVTDLVPGHVMDAVKSKMRSRG